MARRKRVYDKRVKPDERYGNLLVGKFVNNIMKDGKRTVAESIVYGAFDAIHKRTKRGGLNVFEQAIKNISPLVELKSRRIGGANYQVPVPVLGGLSSFTLVTPTLIACLLAFLQPTVFHGLIFFTNFFCIFLSTYCVLNSITLINYRYITNQGVV